MSKIHEIYLSQNQPMSRRAADGVERRFPQGPTDALDSELNPPWNYDDPSREDNPNPDKPEKDLKDNGGKTPVNEQSIEFVRYSIRNIAARHELAVRMLHAAETPGGTPGSADMPQAGNPVGPTDDERLEGFPVKDTADTYPPIDLEGYRANDEEVRKEARRFVRIAHDIVNLDLVYVDDLGYVEPKEYNNILEGKRVAYTPFGHGTRFKRLWNNYYFTYISAARNKLRAIKLLNATRDFLVARGMLRLSGPNSPGSSPKGDHLLETDRYRSNDDSYAENDVKDKHDGGIALPAPNPNDSTFSITSRERRDRGYENESAVQEYMQDARLARRAKSAGIFMPLPKEIARHYPAKAEDDSKPHITVLYLGDVDDKFADAYKKVLESAVIGAKLGKVILKPMDWFHNPEGKWIAHNPVECEGLEDIRTRVWNALDALGLEVNDRFRQYKPHCTIAYCDKPKYEGKTYSGSFKPEKLEIWGFGSPKRIYLKKKKKVKAQIEELGKVWGLGAYIAKAIEHIFDAQGAFDYRSVKEDKLFTARGKSLPMAYFSVSHDNQVFRPSTYIIEGLYDSFFAFVNHTVAGKLGFREEPKSERLHEFINFLQDIVRDLEPIHILEDNILRSSVRTYEPKLDINHSDPLMPTFDINIPVHIEEAANIEVQERREEPTYHALSYDEWLARLESGTREASTYNANVFYTGDPIPEDKESTPYEYQLVGQTGPAAELDEQDDWIAYPQSKLNTGPTVDLQEEEEKEKKAVNK